MASPNILLVDNNKIDIENTKKAFSIIGIQAALHCAESDNEAWVLLLGDDKIAPTPKILLIDINQEGINGIDLLYKIRRHPNLKSLLVFVITNADNDENKAVALNLNIAGYIRKPLESEKTLDLFATLNRYWNSIEYPSEIK